MLGAVNVFAQNTKYLSVYSMMQRTMIYNAEEHEHKGIIRNLPSYAPSYGFTMAQNFNSWLGIEFGFFVSRHEQNFEIYGRPSDPAPALSGRKRLLYVKIPVFARVTLLSRPKNLFFITGGPQLGILMSEDGIIPLYLSSVNGVATDTLVSFDINEAAGAYKRLNFELGASLGWQTKLYKNFYMLFLFRADYTLTDVENKSYSTLFYNKTIKDVYYVYSNKRPATHNIAFGAGIGLCIKIR